MVKPFQRLNHCIRDHPTLAPIQQQLLYHRLIHNPLRSHHHPRLLQNPQQHDPPTLQLTQVVLQGTPIAIVACDGAPPKGKCGRWLQGSQINFYGHLDGLETPAVPAEATLIWVVMTIIQFTRGTWWTHLLQCGYSMGWSSRIWMLSGQCILLKWFLSMLLIQENPGHTRRGHYHLLVSLGNLTS